MKTKGNIIPKTNGTIQADAMHRRVYGDRHVERLENQTAEECAELIAAIFQHRRGDDIEKVCEEIADVEICLEMYKNAIGADKIDRWFHIKTERLNRRLEEVEAGRYQGTREP